MEASLLLLCASIEMLICVHKRPYKHTQNVWPYICVYTMGQSSQHVKSFIVSMLNKMLVRFPEEMRIIVEKASVFFNNMYTFCSTECS